MRQSPLFRLLLVVPVVAATACLGNDDNDGLRATLALPADSVFELRTTVTRASMELGESAVVRGVVRNRSAAPQSVYLGQCGLLVVPEDAEGAIIGDALEGSFCTQQAPADVTLAPGDSLVTSYAWTHRNESSSPRAYAFLADTLVRFRGYLQSRKAIFFATETAPLKVTDTKDVGAEAELPLSTGVSSTRVSVGDTLTVSVRIANARNTTRTLRFTSDCAARVTFTTEDGRLSEQVSACGTDLRTITLPAFGVRVLQVKWKATLPTGENAAVPVTATAHLGVTSPDRVLTGPATQFIVDR